MATLRMIDPMEAEAAKPPKQLTLRERQVIRNILADIVGKDTSTVVEQISDYLKYKDCEFQYAVKTQDDEWDFDFSSIRDVLISVQRTVFFISI